MLKNKNYCMIITAEGYDEWGLDYADNPHKGLLKDVIYGNTWLGLWANGAREYEGLFYQLYSTKTGEKIGYGILDPDSPGEEIKEFEKVFVRNEEVKMEDKQEFLNMLCELLRMTNAGGEGNPLKEIQYIKTEYKEIARPIFENGAGEDGYYDVNITGDSCIGIFTDIDRQFVQKIW